MNVWAVDALSFLLLLMGMRFGQPRFLRALCVIGITYLAIFFAVYYFWLKWKFHYFKTHDEMIHTGILAAFVFQGFWKLFYNMLLLYGVMPVAAVFVLYFAVKWLTSPMTPGSTYY